MSNSEPALVPLGRKPSSRDSLREFVREKESHELVFALAGYVGSGCSTLANSLYEALQAGGFAPSLIRVSRLLDTQSSQPPKSPLQRALALQDFGDELRRRYGGSIIAGLIIRQIRMNRAQSTSEQRAFIIDGLKNPQEEELLRKIYGDSFYLMGVLANEDTRTDRLRDSKFEFSTESEQCAISSREEYDRTIERLMRQDASGERHGQRVKDLLERSDLFIANETGDRNRHAGTFNNFIAATTESRIIRPTRDERGMYAAWAASLKSACMSRQVGASIMDKNGAILSTGANDPPKAGGGTYGPDTAERDDHRCFADRGYCRNDRKKAQIYQEIFEKLRDKMHIDSAEELAQLLDGTRVDALIEFSRAIHAEMDAILTLARQGQSIQQDATLYTTTFPCHSCARHIVAAGISEVVYIEPYGKSLALELHGDAIASVAVRTNQDLDGNKVIFRLFTGVAPRRQSRLFEKKRDLKHGGTFASQNAAKHISPTLTHGFIDLEDELVAQVEKLLKGTHG